MHEILPAHYRTWPPMARLLNTARAIFGPPGIFKWEGLWVDGVVTTTPDFWVRWSWGGREILLCPNFILWCTIIMRWKHVPKWWLFKNRIICAQLNKNSGDDTLIPSITCYVPTSVKLLEPTTPSFEIRIHDYPRFQTWLTCMITHM